MLTTNPPTYAELRLRDTCRTLADRCEAAVPILRHAALLCCSPTDAEVDAASIAISDVLLTSHDADASVAGIGIERRMEVENDRHD